MGSSSPSVGRPGTCGAAGPRCCAIALIIAHRHRRVRRAGEHRRVAAAVERRVVRPAAHVRPAGDGRRGGGRPHRRDGRRPATPCPTPASWPRAEERLIADTQVDASTADQSILVPGRLVGMDLADGGPHVNTDPRRRGRTAASCPSRTPASPWCWSSGTSPTSTTFRRGHDLRVAGDQPVTQRRQRVSAPSTSS